LQALVSKYQKKEENKIMHIALPIGKSNYVEWQMMFRKLWENKPKMRTEVKFNKVQKAKKKPTNYLMGLLAGGQIEMPMAD